MNPLPSAPRSEGALGIPDDVLADIYSAYYERLESIPDIAERTGFSPQAIHNRFVREGWECRAPGWAKRAPVSDEQRAKVIELTNGGRTIREIVAATGLKRAAVRRVRADAGLKGRRGGKSTCPGPQLRERDEAGAVVKKWCPGCSDMVEIDQFWRNAYASDGRQGRCKTCKTWAQRRSDLRRRKREQAQEGAA